MHEGSIADEVIEHATEHARQHGAVRITEIKVTVGAGSHMTVESLRTWLDMIKKGTMAEQASFLVETGEGNSVILQSVVCESPNESEKCELPALETLAG